VFINVLILSEITSRVRNWHNAKLYVRIVQLHIVIHCVSKKGPRRYRL